MGAEVSPVRIRRQVIRIGGLLTLLIALGTFGYYFVSVAKGHRVSLFDCAYMTVITLTTVGYGEVISIASEPEGRLFSTFLLLSGVGILFYALGTLGALIVEGSVRGAWEQWKMEKEINRLSRHFIVCGIGRVGEAILRELVLTRRPSVAVDRDASRLEAIHSETGIPYVVGEATEEEVLRKAGIDRASGLLAALGNDHENLFLVVTARYLNPSLRIVARANDAGVADRTRRAGADEVILPSAIGGLRMVSVMVRPAVVSFLDRMLRERESALRVEEVRVGPVSPLLGRTLAEVNMPTRFGCLVLAYKKGADSFVYIPPPTTVLEEGMTLIVMGEAEKLEKARQDLDRG